MDDSTLWYSKKTNPNPSSIKEKDYAFTALGDINTVRLALKTDYFVDKNKNPKETGFKFLDQQLAWADKYNLHVILDMHVLPGGAIQDYRITKENQKFWNDVNYQDLFIKGWELLAKRYQDNKTILGYELMNEPATEAHNYWELMRRTVEAIRKIDKNHIIIVQATKDHNITELPDKNIIYSFHFYKPLYFTHQGILADSSTKTTYPGQAQDWEHKIQNFDKAVLKKDMQYISDLSRKHNMPVIIGEFGVSTYADEKSMAHWINDVIALTDDLKLSGYIYWRQIAPGKGDLGNKENATFAIINQGGYFSPAQFFGIRPDYAKKHNDLNVEKFWDGSIVKKD